MDADSWYELFEKHINAHKREIYQSFVDTGEVVNRGITFKLLGDFTREQIDDAFVLFRLLPQYYYGSEEGEEESRLCGEIPEKIVLLNLCNDRETFNSALAQMEKELGTRNKERASRSLFAEAD